MISRLKEIRMKHKISQKEMSKILKLAQSQVSNIENNGANTTSEVIERFYEYFGAEDTIYLISGEKIANNNLNENEQKLLEQFRQLNERNQGKVDTYTEERLKEQIKENEEKINKGLKDIG